MSIEIGLLLSILGIVIAFQGYQINKQKHQFEQQNNIKEDSRKDEEKTLKSAEKDVKLQTQLDYIGKGVDDIRIDLKANEKQMVQLGERVTRVEESSKQAHKRIDNIEKESV